MNKYIKYFLIIFCTVLFFNPAYSMKITHPENQYMTVSEDGIFFSGKIEKYEKVYIDGVAIKPEKTGAFSYSVPLKVGENIFAVQKKDFFFKTETLKYIITRINKADEENHNKFIEQEKCYYETTRDNVVLRSTPIDAGMNRMGYLPKGTKVFSDGRKNEFSRIYLSENNYGWVMSKDLISVNLEDRNKYVPQNFISYDCIKSDKNTTYTITLSDNVPYSAVVEDNKLFVTVYNLDNSNEIFTKEYPLDKFPRYSVCMQNGILYITFKKLSFDKNTYSNKKVKIVIDAGHGGKEAGAIGCLGDKEKLINLEVALKLKAILEQHKFNVYLTREIDKFLSLEDRVKYAQDKNALIFISIHMNSVPISSDPNLDKGTVVFYFNPQSKNLAKEISSSVSKDLKIKDNGATQASFAVIRPTEYIGVLAELAYLVNPKDVAVYRNKKFVQTSAMAIYNGLVNYIHSEI
ncbi:N-acetylmuramoyl-L-alanine amidase [bacterium]|nr:N-acetylmuramoyl-L-alanine amidase [bacterium]